MDKVLPITNYDIMPCNQTTWMQAFTAPMYLTSTEENAMVAFFFLDQQMGPPPNINTYPEVDFWSMVSPSEQNL